MCGWLGVIQGPYQWLFLFLRWSWLQLSFVETYWSFHQFGKILWRNLSLPSNRIIASTAIAHLLVCLVVCPLMVHWGWAIFQNKNLTFPALKAFSVLVHVSAGHVPLLTVDSVFALVTPFQYRVIVTNRPVDIASIACWAYFILFGCAFGLWAREDLILGTIFNVKSICILIGILVLNLVILIAFRKHRKNAKTQDQSTANRQIMLQRKRKLSKAIAIVICAFRIWLVPRFIVQFLLYFCTPCSRQLSRLMLVYTLTAALLFANSGVNPFLCAWRLSRTEMRSNTFWKIGESAVSVKKSQV